MKDSPTTQLDESYILTSQIFKNNSNNEDQLVSQQDFELLIIDYSIICQPNSLCQMMSYQEVFNQKSSIYKWNIFRKLDPNQDGKTTFEGFYNVITKKVYFQYYLSVHIQYQCLSQKILVIKYSSIQQDPNKQLPNRLVFPKLIVERKRTISMDNCTKYQKAVMNQNKAITQSPKIIAKSVKTEFNHLKLSNCFKQSVIQEKQHNKSTTQRKLKQLPINTNDFCYAGFESTDTDNEDFSLEAYLKRQ